MTLSRSLAMPRIQLRFRRVARSPCGWTAITSRASPPGAKGKPGGSTPTTVVGSPARLRVVPSTSGFAPSRALQNASVSTTARGRPPRPRREEAASERRPHAQDVEEARRHEEGRQLLRLRATGPGHRRDRVAGDEGEEAGGLELAERSARRTGRAAARRRPGPATGAPAARARRRARCGPARRPPR